MIDIINFESIMPIIIVIAILILLFLMFLFCFKMHFKKLFFVLLSIIFIIYIIINITLPKPLTMDINYLNSISALDIKKVSVKSCKKFFNNKKTSDGIEDNKNAYNADIITSGSYNNNNDEYYYTCYAKDNKTLNKNNFKKDGVYNLVKEYDMTPYGIHIFKNKIFYSFDKNQNILLVYGQKQLPFKIVKVKENISIREEKKYIINLLIIKKDFIFQIRIKTNNENYSSLLYNIFNCYLISTN